jgi:hypothetical protein
MANKTQQIRIESILGGHAQASYSAGADQFLGSLAIDPSSPATLASSSLSTSPSAFLAGRSSGHLRPVGATKFTDSTLTDSALWIVTNPKDTNKYVYAANGSVYSIDVSDNFTGLGDLNDGASASGNGAAYYDNYIYFARDTTVARYGPLNGTPTFTDDYWIGVLGKAPLTDTSNYPKASGVELPNHFLHRHSDGKLYIADMVGGQLTLHYIQTTKTTVEGDTDGGSTYAAFTYGMGIFPTAMESYGQSLVVAGYEGFPSTSNARKKKGAKILFWDTLSIDPNTIIWEEFPDDTISALKNINGVLNIISGISAQSGFRVSTYVGGQSIQERTFIETGYMPLPGAVIGTPSRLLFGSAFAYDSSGNRACVFSLGLEPYGFSSGLFSIQPTSTDDNAGIVTAIDFQNSPGARGVYAAWKGTTYGIDKPSHDSSNTWGNPFWMSQIFKVGKRFKITKIRIPLASPVLSGAIITPVVFTDSFYNKHTEQTINFTNYPNEQAIVLRPENLVGKNDFCLQFIWSGTVNLSIELPITIDYELIDD